MITTKLPHIKKEDTIILYGIQMCIENDTERLENSDELEEIIIGATDEIITNYEQLSNEQRNICVLRINAFLEAYNRQRRKKVSRYANYKSQI
jgi:hypothetical protein